MLLGKRIGLGSSCEVYEWMDSNKVVILPCLLTTNYLRSIPTWTSCL